MKKYLLYFPFLLILLFNLSLFASDQDGLGIRAGIGTDISGGLALGGGINYLLNYDNSALEIGIVIYT
ncbi:MAG: hypothetical protein ABFS12_14015, partial [Bacteroidota bacterium]